MNDETHTSSRRELLEQRERQRRLLRQVPVRMFRDAGWSEPPEPPTDGTADDVERFVRDAADRALTNEAREFLEHSARYEASRWARSSLDRFDRGWIVENAVGPAMDLVTEDPPEDDKFVVERSANRGELLTFAALALVADRAADDDYVDPRVATG